MPNVRSIKNILSEKSKNKLQKFYEEIERGLKMVDGQLQNAQEAAKILREYYKIKITTEELGAIHDFMIDERNKIARKYNNTGKKEYLNSYKKYQKKIDKLKVEYDYYLEKAKSMEKQAVECNKVFNDVLDIMLENKLLTENIAQTKATAPKIKSKR